MEIIENLDGDNIISAYSLRRYDLALEISNVLGKVLNEVHGTSYSQRFWEILMIKYAGITISQHQLYNDPSCNYPAALEEINGLRPPPFKQKLKLDAIKLAKRLRAFNSFSLTRRLLKTENSLSVGFHDLQEVKDELGKAIPIDNVMYFFGKGNKALRIRANAIAAAQEDVFYKNAIKRIPQIYIEYFDEIIKGIPLVSPEKKSFHVHLPCLYNKFILALYVEHGARLYWYQHGAFYGEVLGAGHNLEGRLADEFRSWGWKIGANHRPWKAYRLEYYAKQYRAAPNEKKYDVLVAFPQLHEAVELFYRERITYFLQNISREKYHRFLARPRPLNKVFSHAHLLNYIKKDERVVIDSGLTPMPSLIAASRLVIQLSVPATSFLECIYTDHPTIGILQNKAPTEIIKPYYKFFLEEGVLHPDIESLVNHLNKIDIETWWSQLVSHPVYQEFKHNFARKV